MIFGDGASVRYLCHHDGSLMNGISALKKEATEAFYFYKSLVTKALFFCHVRIQEVGCNLEQNSHQNLTVLAPWPGFPAS